MDCLEEFAIIAQKEAIRTRRGNRPGQEQRWICFMQRIDVQQGKGYRLPACGVDCTYPAETVIHAGSVVRMPVIAQYHAF